MKEVSHKLKIQTTDLITNLIMGLIKKQPDET